MPLLLIELEMTQKSLEQWFFVAGMSQVSHLRTGRRGVVLSAAFGCLGRSFPNFAAAVA
jgi:hypothetical protein